MKHLDEEKGGGRNQEKGWGGILIGLVDAVAENISSSVGRTIREKQESFFRSLMAGFSVAVGALFFLNGLAVFINEYAGKELFSWLGYMSVGFVLVLLGMVFPKKGV